MQDHQEVQAVADSIRYAFVDPDATEEIDRDVSAAVGEEASDDADDQC
jgi:hypothetical protein